MVNIALKRAAHTAAARVSLQPRPDPDRKIIHASAFIVGACMPLAEHAPAHAPSLYPACTKRGIAFALQDGTKAFVVSMLMCFYAAQIGWSRKKLSRLLGRSPFCSDPARDRPDADRAQAEQQVLLRRQRRPDADGIEECDARRFALQRRQDADGINDRTLRQWASAFPLNGLTRFAGLKPLRVGAEAVAPQHYRRRRCDGRS
jgi:hypothetical protein